MRSGDVQSQPPSVLVDDFSCGAKRGAGRGRQVAIGASDAEQGPGDHALLLDDQGAVYDGRGNGRRLPERDLGFGLTKTTLLTAAVLVAALVLQFWVRRYVPWIYWVSVVLISIVGTLITDNLTDNFGVSLVTTTIVFSVGLALVFAAWYASERTLSIHTIVTTRREGFYWLTVLFTFALGTAAGDLTAERLAVGYWKSALLFAALIGIVYALHLKLGLNAILAFWIAYILTRPLGASIGDYLSQPKADGGLGLGTTVTSVIFLLTILTVVVYLSLTKVDVIEGKMIAIESRSAPLRPCRGRHACWWWRIRWRRPRP